jgi:hypothetical protein
MLPITLSVIVKNLSSPKFHPQLRIEALYSEQRENLAKFSLVTSPVATHWSENGIKWQINVLVFDHGEFLATLNIPETACVIGRGGHQVLGVVCDSEYPQDIRHHSEMINRVIEQMMT